MIAQPTSPAFHAATGSDFRIVYGPGRFPIQQKRADGSLGCRGCGSEIPKGRTSWCSSKCWDTYEPSRVIAAAKQRDNEICCVCGHDYKAAYAEWYKQCFQSGIHHRSSLARLTRPKKIEYDHIVPFSEGGLTILENMRSLCDQCHKERTRRWHRDRVEAKNAQDELSLDTPNSVIEPTEVSDNHE